MTETQAQMELRGAAIIVFHYGYSVGRFGYTLCGKRTDEVTVTYHGDRVTCSVCYNELGLSAARH